MKPETITTIGLVLLAASLVVLAAGCGSVRTVKAEGKFEATQEHATP